MTHLQKITTLAKKIRKQHPSKKWTDCVKAASKELKAGKKVAGYTGTRRDGNKTTVSYTNKSATTKKPAKATQAKLFGTSKKHTDTKSHNINVTIGNILNKKNKYHENWIKEAETQLSFWKTFEPEFNYQKKEKRDALKFWNKLLNDNKIELNKIKRAKKSI